MIGEAVRALPADLRGQRPHVAWSEIVGVRNILVHHYFGIDVWTMHVVDEKRLRKLLRQGDVLWRR